MKKQFLRISFILFFLSAPASAAIGDKEPVEPIIDRVMELSGYSRFIEQIPQHAQAQLEQQPLPDATAEEAQRFKAIAMNAMSAERLHTSVAQHLRNNYDAQKFNELLTMLDSELARKMTELELTANSVEAQKEFQAFASSLSISPPNPDRVALTKRYLEAAGALDAMIAVQLGMAENMMRATFVLDQEKQMLPEDELRETLDQMRSQLELPLADYLMAFAFFVYKDVSDSEFKDYIDMHESPPGRFLTTLLNEATVVAFKNAGEEFGRGLAEEFSQRKAERANASK